MVTLLCWGHFFPNLKTLALENVTIPLKSKHLDALPRTLTSVRLDPEADGAIHDVTCVDINRLPPDLECLELDSISLRMHPQTPTKVSVGLQSSGDSFVALSGTWTSSITSPDSGTLVYSYSTR